MKLTLADLIIDLPDPVLEKLSHLKIPIIEFDELQTQPTMWIKDILVYLKTKLRAENFSFSFMIGGRPALLKVDVKDSLAARLKGQ